jgi:hypothetical protein
MKTLRRAMFLGLFVLTALTAGAADEFSDTPVFTFTAKSGPELVNDPDKELSNASGSLTMRPNNAGEFFLYAYNPEKAKKAYIVEVKGGPGSSLNGTAKVTIPGKKWMRIRVTKPAPAAAPAAAPVPAPAPAAAAAPAAPPEVLPPGSELASESNSFSFTLRLLNDDGTPATDTDGKAYGRKVGVTVQKPDDYIAAPAGTISLKDRLTQVAVTVSGKPDFTGTANLMLAFPPQESLKDAIIREGIYKRTLTREPNSTAAPKATLSGAVENAVDKLRIHLGVDGFDRAFIYQPALAGDTANANLIRVATVAVRILPAVGFNKGAETQPVAAFPVKIEADNDPAGSTLELWIRKAGDGNTFEKNEIIKLGGARDERVWVEVAGPVDGGVLISSTSKDWLKPLDIRNFRGKCEVVAVLKNKQLEGGKVESAPFALTIDANIPERLEFVKFPEKHIKGTPLPVTVTGTDLDTRIEKVLFILGKPGDDGKFPSDAAKVEGLAVIDKNKIPTGAYTALLPVPADKRGEMYISAVLIDAVGLSVTKTQRIELVDAPPPTGSINGTISIGERRQPGIKVLLLNGEGKEKAAAVTNEYGRYKFEKVPVGDYVVFAEKPDSSYGSEGKVAVQVKAEQTAKPAIDLKKRTK